jgi:hypothetical protein
MGFFVVSSKEGRENEATDGARREIEERANLLAQIWVDTI